MGGARSAAVPVKLDPDEWQRMKRLALKRRRSPNWLMRDAIHQYIEREEAREAYLRRGEDAWRHFRDTGLHATGQEVADWVSTWGTEDEAPPPTCHK